MIRKADSARWATSAGWSVVGIAGLLIDAHRPQTRLRNPNKSLCQNPGVHVVNITTADEKGALHNDSFQSAGQVAEASPSTAMPMSMKRVAHS
jgi:hypothetical protein